MTSPIKRSDNKQCISELIQHNADQNTNAIAILAPDRPPLSYAQLYQQTQYVQLMLTQVGIAKNDRVVIVLPNGPEMAVAFLTVGSCATSAPLNPAYRTEEFDFYVSDLNAKAVIVESDSKSPVRIVARQRNIPIIELFTNPGNDAGKFTLTESIRASAIPTGYIQPDDIALVLHTSGTTSRPKIVPLSHNNLCVSARNIQQTLKLTEHDRCLNIMPLFHIHGLVGVLLSSILAGGSVICTPGFNAKLFFEWMKIHRPTWYSAVPTMHQAILDQTISNNHIISRNQLRFIRSSSASLPPTAMSELESTFNTPVIESYGMTEAAHQMTSNLLPPRDRKPGSVGVAAGPEIAIMDRDGTLLSEYQAGEIVIRGTNVTQGYDNNPEANRDAFTKGWFRTGDQGYLDADGYLYITGRIKELINRGGEKIAPREIDEVLLGHPEVAQAVAFAVPHPTLGEDVAAAVILKEGGTVEEKLLRKYTLTHMAEHRVPSRIIIVNEIPKGPTGKLQRIGLADKLASELTTKYIPPKGEAEQTLSRIWNDVLKRQCTGRDDNFFSIGGDSLMAARIAARIQSTFQIELSIKMIFEDPTLKGQAALIEETILNEIESMSDEEASQS